jgi:hypothetical protein
VTFGSVWNGRTPFLIRLRDHITRPSPAPEQFLDLIAATIAGLMPAGWVHRQLGAGATLCIDGVDEFPEAPTPGRRPGRGAPVPEGQKPDLLHAACQDPPADAISRYLQRRMLDRRGHCPA